jgi:hypothetical protein
MEGEGVKSSCKYCIYQIKPVYKKNLIAIAMMSCKCFNSSKFSTFKITIPRDARPIRNNANSAGYIKTRPQNVFPGKPFFLRLSQKIKVIQLLTVPHDVTLDLAGVNPGNVVLHIAGD